MLDNVVSSDLESEINYKNDEFYGLYELGMGKYINSIRDCNRILNAFSMRYYSLKKNVYVSDLLALTVLSLYERSIYLYIVQHTNIFMGLSDEGILSLKMEEADDVLKNKIYKNVSDEFHNNVRYIICKLFPKFSELIGGNSYSKEHSYKNYRVCFDDFFDRYFEFDLDESDTTLYEAKKLINDMDENEAKEFIEQKYNVYGLDKLVGQLSILLSLDGANTIFLNYKQADKLIMALYTAKMKYEYVSGRPTIAYKWELLNIIVSNLVTFQEISYEQYIDLIKSLLQRRSLDMNVVTDIILCCSLGGEWVKFLNINYKPSNQIIKDDDMEEIKNIYFNRTEIWIKEIIEKDKDIDIRNINPNMIRLIYKYYIENINELFKNVDSHYEMYIINVLLLLILFNRVENGADRITYWPKEIEINDFKNRIESIVKSGKITLSDYNRTVVDRFITGQIVCASI